jgi:hypothetical protein
MGKKIVPKAIVEEMSYVLYTKPTCKGAADTTRDESPRQWINVMRKTYKGNRFGLGHLLKCTACH